MDFPVTLKNDHDFPDTRLAKNIDLLAIGGDLSTKRLIQAYQRGIFPWFDKPPILWWSPVTRAIFLTNKFYLSKSLRKHIRNLTKNNSMEITFNKYFSQVIQNCANREEGTWINQIMINAYLDLHQFGYAHSIELWETIKNSKTLIGGIYGVKIGRMFCGESMFSKKNNASKVLLAELCQWMSANDMPILDAQIPNQHLTSLGAISISRADYEYFLRQLIDLPIIEFPDKLKISNY